MLHAPQTDLRIRDAVVKNASPILETALALASAGVAVHWLKAKSKRPLLDEWPTAPVATPDSLRATYRPGFNLGIRTGEPSKVDGLFLHVIDLDVRDEAKAAEPYAWLDANWPQWRSFPVVQSGSLGSSRHVYAFLERPYRSRKLARSTEHCIYDGKKVWAWQIEIYGTSKQVAAPPSIHPISGKPYRWRKEIDFDAVALGCAPILSADLVRSWAALPADEPPRESGADKLDLSPDEAREIVFKLPLDEWCEDREGWLKVGMALQHEFGDDGLELWNDFSAQSDKFDPEDQERVWKSFRPRPDSIRMATLKRAVRDVEIAESFEEIEDDESDEEGGALDDLLGPETEQNTSELSGALATTKPTGRKLAAGDIEAGRKFSEAYRDQFLHIFRSRVWLRWDGFRWADCSRGEEVEAAKNLAYDILVDAVRANAKHANDLNKAKYQYAVRLNRDGQRVRAVLEMARSEPALSRGEEQFDTNEMLLGVKNGVLDLRAGSLIEPRPSHLIRKQAGAAFDPSAKCPRWIRFLNDVLPDPDVRRFVQVAVGYTLSGSVEEEKFFFAYGNGANGKSVFATVCEALLGDYAVTVNATLLTRSRNDGESARLVAKLPGARLVLANETKQADVWDDQRVKEIVSRDRISARKLYAESFSFLPTHKLWVRGNHLPGAFDDSEGFWRRLVPIPFVAQLPLAARIPDLDRQIIKSELSGVLNWALEGCLAWQRDKLMLPNEIRKTADSYRRDTDLLGTWLGECCSIDPNAKTKISELFESYRYFCSTQGMSSPAKMTFSRQLVQRPGVRKDASHKHGHRAIWLRLRPDSAGFADLDSTEC